MKVPMEFFGTKMKVLIWAFHPTGSKTSEVVESDVMTSSVLMTSSVTVKTVLGMVEEKTR